MGNTKASDDINLLEKIKIDSEIGILTKDDICIDNDKNVMNFYWAP